MNDPNGLVYYQGRYHLFFQHNPAGSDWGNMSWGHASSRDLIRWTEHPVAIPATPDEAVFSGSVVVDWENTSGFGRDGRPPLVAVYTSVYPDGIQAQSLAYSLDEGLTWHKHPGNPVLSRNSTAFRDPKVFRYQERGSAASYWVLVAVEAEASQVLLYRSPDLKNWTWLSTFEDAPAQASDQGPASQLWECPDLFPLDDRWVLLVSVNPDTDGPGSATRYFVGDFDGSVFTPDPVAAARLDGGPDCYAAVTFDNAPDGRRIAVAWMSDWRYAASVPTSPWRGAMTAPRDLSLRRMAGQRRLVQRPVAELAATSGGESVRSESRDPESRQNGRGGLRTVQLNAGDSSRLETPAAYRLDLSLAPAGDDARVLIRLRAADNSTVTIDLDAAAGTVTVDRSASGETGFHPDFAKPVVAAAPRHEGAGPRGLTLLVDATSVELFAEDGALCVTTQVFPCGQWTDLAIEGLAGSCAVTLGPLRDLTAAASSRDRVVGRDVLVTGEALIDVIKPAADGTAVAVPGGSPLNVAIGLQRLGIDTALHTQFGTDRYGQVLAEYLAANGVAVLPGIRTGTPTAVAEAILTAAGSATYTFAIDWTIRPLGPEFPAVRVMHTGSLGALLEPGATAVLADVERARTTATITYDPNIRSQLAGRREAARAQVERLVARADVVKASDEDLAWLYPGTDAEAVLATWLGLGALVVVVTRGARGAVARTTAHRRVEIPAPHATVVDTVGAGDAFMSGLIAELVRRGLAGRENARRLAGISAGGLRQVLEFASWCAAVTVSRAGANPPTAGELYELTKK